jgi:addiction module RelB/DinJ family antitoxin
MNTTINIRIDAKKKKDVKKILDEFGFDISSAVKVFLEKVVAVRGIPFAIHGGGRMSDPAFIAMIKKEVREAETSGKRFKDIKSLLKELDA